MILVLAEDGVLRVYDTPERVAGKVEALDAEETLRAVFDERAQPYAIEWIRPNRKGRKWFGLFRSVANGEYRLAPCGQCDEAGLLRAIRSAVAIEPISAVPVVREIESRLTGRTS